MLITFFLILLLARVSSCDLGCVWEKEPKMSVGEIMFRRIFLTPFGYDLNTGPLPDLCRGNKPASISFWEYWGDALSKSLPRFDCFCNEESSRTIGEEMFRAIFWSPFRLVWDPHGGNKPPDKISFWHYWDDPVFIFLDFLFAICLTILVYTCVLSLAFLVAEEKTKTNVGTQANLTADKAIQTGTCKTVRIHVMLH